MPFLVFIFGFLAAALSLVLELIFIPPASFSQTTALSFTLGNILILAAIALIEEISKYALLLQYLFRFSTQAVTHTSSRILVAIFFGLGFSTLELTMAYYSIRLSQMSAGLFGIVLLHVLTSFILVFLPSRFQDPRKKLLLPLTAATLLHLLYNVLLSFFLS